MMVASIARSSCDRVQPTLAAACLGLCFCCEGAPDASLMPMSIFIILMLIWVKKKEGNEPAAGAPAPRLRNV